MSEDIGDGNAAIMLPYRCDQRYHRIARGDGSFAERSFDFCGNRTRQTEKARGFVTSLLAF